MKIAISGASGKTGFRLAEEAKRKGHQVVLLTRKNSKIPDSINSIENQVITLNNESSLDNAMSGCDALIIATGARPSIDLTGPARVDACGVTQQVKSCQRVGIERVLLVSSLCAGKLIHPLNLFGLILIWKRIGEKALENSGLDWTIIRPGGLNEIEEGIQEEGIQYSSSNTQEEGSIPRRLVAKCCIEALNSEKSINQIIEITSTREIKPKTLDEALRDF